MLLVRKTGAQHANGAPAPVLPCNLAPEAGRREAEVQAHEAPGKGRGCSAGQVGAGTVQVAFSQFQPGDSVLVVDGNDQLDQAFRNGRGRRHGGEKGGAFVGEQDAMVGLEGDGCDRAVGQCDQLCAGLLGGVGNAHCLGRVGGETDHDDRIVCRDGAQLQLYRAFAAPYQRHRSPEQAIQVMQQEGNGKRRAKAGDVDVTCLQQGPCGPQHAVGTLGFRGVEVGALCGKEFGHQLVAVAAADDVFGLERIGLGFPGQPFDKECAQFRPADKTQMLRQTHERGGLHLGLLRQGPHGRDRHFAGIVQQVGGARLELGTHVDETFPDQGFEFAESAGRMGDLAHGCG